MKSCEKLILCCALAVLALPLAGALNGASAQSVLLNYDFETGDLTGWEVAGGNAVATAAVQSPDNGPTLPGTNNAFMQNFGEAVGLTLKQTTMPGTATTGEITYSFDLKLDEADVGGVLFVEIFAEQEGVGIVGGSGLLGPYWPWNAWATYTGSFVAPAGTSFLTVQVMANTGAAVGTSCVAHVDNVIVDGQGTVPTAPTSWDSVKAQYR